MTLQDGASRHCAPFSPDADAFVVAQSFTLRYDGAPV